MSKKIFFIFGALILVVIAVWLYQRLVPQGLVSKPTEQEEVYNSEEHGFSVNIPEGWTYKTSPERVGQAVLAVQLKSADKKITIPIFVEEKAWDLVKSDIKKNFKPEAVQEIALAGQPAIKVVAKEKEINPGYSFRIKHPRKENTVLLGTASYTRGEDLDTFHNSVETVLNSIKFD